MKQWIGHDSMQFAEIQGCFPLKNILLNAVSSNRVAHAQLFIGDSGSANLMWALAFATYLNCTSRSKENSCGSCFSCTAMEQLIHPDFQLLFPRQADAGSEVKDLNIFRNCVSQNSFLTLAEWATAASYDSGQLQIIKKDTTAILKRLSWKSFCGRYKIVLIWLPEYFNHVAANALLKTLEEPPEHTVFLLVSCHSEQILPTIRSRVQLYYIPPFSTEAIERYLHKKYADLEYNLCKKIAFLAEGNVSKALQLIQQTTPDHNHFEQFSNWLRSCYRGDYTKLVMQSEIFHKLSSPIQKSFFSYALQLIRITLLNKVNPTVVYTNLTHEDKFSKQFGLNVTIDQLKSITLLFNRAYYCLERNANVKMIYIYTSLQIVNLFKAVGPPLIKPHPVVRSRVS